jgi:hypothetical protein
VVLGCVLLVPPARAGIAPSKTEINLGPVPIDRYFTANSDGIVPTCPSTYTVRECYKSFFNNNSAERPYRVDNYVGQGITGVRFFYALGGGYASTPFRSDGSLQSAWRDKLFQFFTDLKSYGIQRITPTSVFLGNWSGSDAGCDGCLDYTRRPQTLSCNQRKDLKFFRWVPFGFLDKPGAPDDGFPDGQDLNNAYNCASGNPVFWGWQPFFNLVDSVLLQAKRAGLTVADFDIENEVNLMDFTVEARLIYDNIRKTDVLGTIRNLMSKHGFQSGRATFSVPVSRATQPGYTCTSYFGDSALLMTQSELNAAYRGQPFGLPANFSWINGLPCGGTNSRTGTGGTMITLPKRYTVPTAINIHTHICVPGDDWQCNASVDATPSAKATYDAVWNFMARNGYAAPYVVFGETVSNQACGEWTKEMAVQNVNGYRNSTLYTNNAANTVLRVWNNSADFSGCSVTPHVINPPYDPANR